MKECVKCKQSKELTDFYKTKYGHKKDGYDYYCKYCRVGTAIKSQKAGNNKKSCSIEGCERLHYAKSWCRVHYSRWLRNGTTVRKFEQAWDSKESRLRNQYLITLAEYNERSANGCEICGDKPNHSFHVDHDHKCCPSHITCGKCVRGIICSSCNKAVDSYERGFMREDYPKIDMVKKYLEVYNAKKG